MAEVQEHILTWQTGQYSVTLPIVIVI